MAENFFVKRNHLTNSERPPRCYKDAEKILKSVRMCKGSLKTVMHKSKLRGYHLSKVYSLSLNVLKHNVVIQKILQEVKLLEKEPALQRECAEIMVYELLFGKGSLPGESKPVLALQKYQDEILNTFQSLSDSGMNQLTESLFSLPRYARVNTLLTTVSNVVEELMEFGYQQISLADDVSEKVFLENVTDLTRGKFLIDYHFKDLLVFASDENLYSLYLYQKGHIFLQDKSSYIPVHVLNPEPDSIVVDACAAPGMKAVHLAAKMENKGILYAIERNTERFNVLKQMLDIGGVTIGKPFNKDFKSLNPESSANSKVRYILLDPSCSGSGMVSRMDSVTDTDESKNETRLRNLAGFQIILLKHALRFPSVEKVVYSTCSINEEENEYVVHEALNAFKDQFRLQKVEPDWTVRGSENYEYGDLCLRCFPEKNLTNGFFVALFERLKNDDLKFGLSAKTGRKSLYNRPEKNFKLSLDNSKSFERSATKKGDSFKDSKRYDEKFSLPTLDPKDFIKSSKKIHRAKTLDSLPCSTDNQTVHSSDYNDFIQESNRTFKTENILSDFEKPQTTRERNEKNSPLVTQTETIDAKRELKQRKKRKNAIEFIPEDELPIVPKNATKTKKNKRKHQTEIITVEESASQGEAQLCMKEYECRNKKDIGTESSNMQVEINTKITTSQDKSLMSEDGFELNFIIKRKKKKKNKENNLVTCDMTKKSKSIFSFEDGKQTHKQTDKIVSVSDEIIITQNQHGKKIDKKKSKDKTQNTNKSDEKKLTSEGNVKRKHKTRKNEVENNTELLGWSKNLGKDNFTLENNKDTYSKKHKQIDEIACASNDIIMQNEHGREIHKSKNKDEIKSMTHESVLELNCKRKHKKRREKHIEMTWDTSRKADEDFSLLQDSKPKNKKHKHTHKDETESTIKESIKN